MAKNNLLNEEAKQNCIESKSNQALVTENKEDLRIEVKTPRAIISVRIDLSLEI